MSKTLNMITEPITSTGIKAPIFPDKITSKIFTTISMSGNQNFLPGNVEIINQIKF